jgi:hypothetical protein
MSSLLTADEPMSNVQRIHLGPESSPLQQGRGAHGRWRVAYQRAEAVPEGGSSVPAALDIVQDSERLVFAMTEGPAAVFLSGLLADYLWTRESADGEWPLNLREWLADTSRWKDAPPGRTAFICGRLERAIAGGRIYLAWLGMSGVRLTDRADTGVALDTVIGPDEGWSRESGPEPVGMALHAYRGGLFGLERLAVLSPGASVFSTDLPDLSATDLQQALEDWSAEAERDLALFDLRLNPVLSEPTGITLNFRWIAPELCMLFWQPSPNVTAYRIEESPTPGFEEPTLVAEMTDGRQVMYRFSPPVSGTRYYRVVPLNQGVPGVPSEAICPTPVVLTEPILEPIEWSADGGYYLHWTPIPQATGYEVQTSDDPEFDVHHSEIFYRGELPETYLAPDTPPNAYYRVRAINVLYAPHLPSPWSQPARSPARLETPTFTRVTQERLEWEAVPGARQYAMHVTAVGEDESQGEDVFTVEPVCPVADQPATYRVRAFRHPGDESTASEWSDSVTVSPALPGRMRGRPDLRLTAPVVAGAAIVALLVGVGLGLIGLEAYQNASATSTRTPIPQSYIDATNAAATLNVRNATAVDQLGTAAQATQSFFLDQTATAAAWTATPTATASFTPSVTPNLTETMEAAFSTGLTATAAQWTATPSPTATVTPSITPNLTGTVHAMVQVGMTATADRWTMTPSPTASLAPSVTPNLTTTIDAAFRAGLTATAAQWTPAPTATVTFTPSATPNLTKTIDTAFRAGLTGTAAIWTPTPTLTATFTPSVTPNLSGTIDAALQAGFTATAALWTPTPPPSVTPDWTATVDALIAAHLSAGCFVINPPGAVLPVHSGPYSGDQVILDAVPRLAEVVGREALPAASGGASVIWLEVRATTENGGTITGWMQVPEDVPEDQLYGGPDCPASGGG